MRGKGRHDPCVLPRATPMVEVRQLRFGDWLKSVSLLNLFACVFGLLLLEVCCLKSFFWLNWVDWLELLVDWLLVALSWLL